WLDQRLASELYVTARDEDEAARLRAWLAPRSDAVLPIWHTDGEVAGMPVEIYGVADHATYRDNWPVIEGLPGHWDMIARGDGALINEQLWRRAKLDVGSEISLPGGWRGRIAGVYSDYGNPSGQVMVGLDSLLTIAPDVPKLRQAVRVAPDRAAALAEDLRRSFDLPPQNLVDQAAVKAFSLRTFERTFKVTAALNVLTLGVAGLAIFTSLLTLAAMRLPQLAPVWALGLTRRRLAALELLRAVMLAAVTALAALPLGLALAAILLNVINVEAFGWKLPMQIFPGDWLVLLLLALAAAALAALVPAWRLARIAPAELLKVFAHER
ncbi:MAG: ABC transporter permease, partial [Alphaproteobacteria bacterium]|nr:ABC transporter permease [Alphaproteobacteria bacterium]